MARVLIISSVVSYGYVGASAALPALGALGHEATVVPTVQLSNHPAWPHVAGGRVPPERIDETLDVLAANGWLANHDAILTGYLPSPEHALAAARAVRRLKEAAPEARVVIDPVLGDAPKGLYVDKAAAEAIKTHLLPLAEILTPNAFELGWLADAGPERLGEAITAAQNLATGAEILLTSPPLQEDKTGVLACKAEKLYETPREIFVQKGTGDVFAAFTAAGLPPAKALGHLSSLIKASSGADHLAIVSKAEVWTRAAPIEASGDDGIGRSPNQSCRP